MLHTTPLSHSAENNKRCRQLRDTVCQDLSEPGTDLNQTLFALLVNTARFEFRFRTLYQYMLDNKEQKWQSAKEEARIRVQDLATIFGSGIYY